MNGYNFTERVRKVLAMARDEAGRLHHEYVGTEHLLLALLREGEGVGANVLQSLDVSPEDLTRLIEAVVTPGTTARTADAVVLPYTSRAKKGLELSMAEARDLEHSYVGTEHLLLGLLREEKGIAAQVLNEAGVRLDRARAETLRLHGTEALPNRSSAPSDHISSGISSIAIEVRLTDGTQVREEFGSVVAALDFLRQEGHRAARRVDGQ